MMCCTGLSLHIESADSQHLFLSVSIGLCCFVLAYLICAVLPAHVRLRLPPSFQKTDQAFALISVLLPLRWSAVVLLSYCEVL